MANSSSLNKPIDLIIKKDISLTHNLEYFQLKIDKALQRIKNSIDKDKDNPFLLISGDLSGIQNTVYTISSKGALKSLRARSFMLELLCEHCCYELITSSFGEYDTNNVIFSGGGGFCLLLPNTTKTLETIVEFKKSINNWAFEEFGGKLYVAIDSISTDENNLLNNFKSIWEELSEKLEKDKKHKFSYNLEVIFKESELKEPYQRNNSQECQICHRDNIGFKKDEVLYSISEDESTKIIKINNPKLLENESENSSKMIVHELCYNLLLLGRILKHTKKIYRYNKPSSDSAFISLPSIVTNNNVVYMLEGNKGEKCIHKWSINEFNDSASTPFLFSNYDADKLFPLQTVDFKILANASMGANLIGCLRMDVDDLGKKITENLNPFNLVTLSQLSFNLNYFFKVHLSKICESGKSPITSKDYSNGRAVSVVYAGGDDLFIVGAWDEVAEIAVDIQKEFSEYFRLGISAGLTLHKHDFPFYQMARQSEEALSNSKNEFNDKNRFTPFFTIDTKEFIYRNKDEIEEYLKTSNRSNNLTDTFLYAKGLPREDLKRINLSVSWCNFEQQCSGIVKGLFNKSPKISNSLLYKMFNLLEIWYEDEGIVIPKLLWIIDDSKKYGLSEIILSRFLDENIRTFHLPLTWYKYLRS